MVITYIFTVGISLSLFFFFFFGWVAMAEPEQFQC